MTNVNIKLFILANILLNISVNCQTQSYRVMQHIFLLDLIEMLERGENFVFVKYGDGEYECMRGSTGQNCDRDSYHPWLGEALKKALISLSKKKNAYIGKWHAWAPDPANYCDKIASEHGAQVPWVGYHTFMNDDEFMKYDYMYKFVNFLAKTTRKKIVVCNKMNSRLTLLVKADVFIEIPPRNWSYEYEKWRNELSKHVEENSIVLISGGLCSKVLIDDITNECPELTCIDLGSSFDLLTRKVNTRGWKHTYQQEVNYYKNLLPIGW